MVADDIQAAVLPKNAKLLTLNDTKNAVLQNGPSFLGFLVIWKASALPLSYTRLFPSAAIAIVMAARQSGKGRDRFCFGALRGKPVRDRCFLCLGHM